MTKKWYNYFVSSDANPEATPTGGASAENLSQAGAKTSAAQTVAEIAAMIQPEPAFSGSVEKPGSFMEIYQQAEIQTPPHGYNILKILDMLQSEHIRNLPAEVKKSSVLLALEAAGVSLKEVVEDAVRRDRALDTYERVMQKSVEELEKQKTEENRQLEQDMEKMVAEYRAKIQANTEALTRRKEEFFGWRLQKQQEEKRIADAVGYFVTENPITTSAPPVVGRESPKNPGPGRKLE
jgi:Asp-tRNA(Asn)/Glu-tRNA(Gln) amidotransferase A subunit family amidase